MISIDRKNNLNEAILILIDNLSESNEVHFHICIATQHFAKTFQLTFFALTLLLV